MTEQFEQQEMAWGVHETDRLLIGFKPPLRAHRLRSVLGENDKSRVFVSVLTLNDKTEDGSQTLGIDVTGVSDRGVRTVVDSVVSRLDPDVVVEVTEVVDPTISLFQQTQGEVA